MTLIFNEFFTWTDCTCYRAHSQDATATRILNFRAMELAWLWPVTNQKFSFFFPYSFSNMQHRGWNIRNGYDFISSVHVPWYMFYLFWHHSNCFFFVRVVYNGILWTSLKFTDCAKCILTHGLLLHFVQPMNFGN